MIIISVLQSSLYIRPTCPPILVYRLILVMFPGLSEVKAFGDFFMPLRVLIPVFCHARPGLSPTPLYLSGNAHEHVCKCMQYNFGLGGMCTSQKVCQAVATTNSIIFSLLNWWRDSVPRCLSAQATEGQRPRPLSVQCDRVPNVKSATECTMVIECQ